MADHPRVLMKTALDIKSLYEISADFLKEHRMAGVIFDLDDTLIPEFHGRFSPEDIEYLATLQAHGIVIGILTNNMSRQYCLRIVEQLEQNGIHASLLMNALKPFPFSVDQLLSCMGTPKNETLFVGDGFITDWLCAKLAGMSFVRARWFFQRLRQHVPSYWLVREALSMLMDIFRLVFLGHFPKIYFAEPRSEGQEAVQKPYLFLVNPASGKTEPEALRAMIDEEARRLNAPYRIALLASKPRFKQKYGFALKQNRYSAVVACGGDGTVRGVLTLIAKSNRQIPLGIIPTGTGNLLAKALYIPEDIRAAVQQVFRAVPQPLSITSVNRHFAALVVGVGADAEIMHQTTTLKKKLLGPLAYVLSAINMLLFKKKAYYFIELDGRLLMRRADGVLLIQRNQYKRAFLQSTHAQAESDEVLDVCIIKTRQAWEVFSVIDDVFNADYASNPLIEHYQARVVNLSAWPQEKIQLDGDVIDDTTIRVKVLKDHISVLVSPVQAEDAPESPV